MRPSPDCRRHTFGKAHGAGAKLVGPNPKPHRWRMGFGWLNQARQRQRGDTTLKRHRRRLDAEPDDLGHELLLSAVQVRWELTEEPGRRHQWRAWATSSPGT